MTSETFYRRGFFVLLLLLVILAGCSIWLLSRADRKAGELASRADRIQGEYYSNLGRLAELGNEVTVFAERYSDLNKQYQQLGIEISEITGRLGYTGYGLGELAAEIRNARTGLQQNISGIDGLIESIRSSIETSERVSDSDYNSVSIGDS